MSIRKRVGYRRWTATFTRHNGEKDSYGQPTYGTPNDWYIVSFKWPCELTTTIGGEVLRGRQVNEKTTHVAFGEFAGLGEVIVEDRCTIAGVHYGIVNISDPDGISQEVRIELRGENG